MTNNSTVSIKWDWIRCAEKTIEKYQSYLLKNGRS